MPSNYYQIVEMLSRDFTTEKIMIPLAELISANSKDECLKLSKKHDDLDIIPFVQKEAITGYWDKRKMRIVPLSPKHIITNSTTILHLIDLFDSHEFFFVMSGPEVVGFVHRSDLNNDLLKIPFYILLQSLESLLLEKLSLSINDVQQLSDNARVKQITDQHMLKMEGDMHIDSVQGLYLSEILEISKNREVLNLSGSMKHLLEDFRNRVSHADRSLLNKPEEISYLKQVKDYCLTMLEQLT